MPSFIYYGVQHRGAKKIVTSVHDTWAHDSTISQNLTLRVQGQPWDPFKPGFGADASRSPEERIVLAATQCGAQEVWKFQLPAAPASGPYASGVPAFDDAAQNSGTPLGYGQVVTGDIVAQVVGVNSPLPAGSVVVSWGRNDGPTAKPVTPWSN
ncbi:hypothetical protein [Pseudorhodoferax sp. Leaf265]|uniref:hypothetical protein n=1 Tax=Pseudorhodoferax sp. Leaf265 TaxID=1736315 RepID=UPI0006FA45D1|nr:hypothetical protein [Pseudorhodoferax sp. Leaf265]KQP19953.1 hypothetical protein ASF45_22930 [Pseudorhodoferax sp. Leaf265]